MLTSTIVYIEVHLTSAQIHERRLKLEQELDEQDKLTGDVASKKLEIKDTNVAIERVTARVRQLRSEIRLGYVMEAREAQLQLPSPDIDDTLLERPADPSAAKTSPPPPPRDVFADLYPAARTHGALRDDLHDGLTDSEYSLLVNGTIEAWHPDTGIFQGVAHWARVARAHADSAGRAAAGEPGIAGLNIPALGPKPIPLVWLLKGDGTNGNGKAKGKPAKKRRSGSTANSG